MLTYLIIIINLIALVIPVYLGSAENKEIFWENDVEKLDLAVDRKTIRRIFEVI